MIVMEVTVRNLIVLHVKMMVNLPVGMAVVQRLKMIVPLLVKSRVVLIAGMDRALLAKIAQNSQIVNAQKAHTGMDFPVTIVLIA
jgi:hypothetical protein